MVTLNLDTWAALDFKDFASKNKDTIWSWVGDDKRRLQAYVLLKSYVENSSRFFISGLSDEERDERIELGDAALICETVLSALLGNDVSVVCDGNEDLESWAQWWVKKTRAVRKLFTAETNAVELGDAVVALHFDAKRKRVEMKTYDPGSYFPVLDDDDDLEFPRKIHIAWEFEREDDQGRLQSWIRRKTWELDDEDQCYFSDGEWLIEDLGVDHDVYKLPRGAARWYQNAGKPQDHVLLPIDFIPIIHWPNTVVDDDQHFGKSSISYVLQILDEIQNTDSDLSKGAAVAGFPPLATDGETVNADGTPITTYGPGSVFSGQITAVDTSRSLDALLKYLEQLLRRLSSNARTPESALGRIRPSDVPSGLAFALGFAPMTAMIAQQRLIRIEKYPLIIKFAYKMTAAAGWPAPSVEIDEDNVEEWNETPWPTFVPGSFLPSDLETTMNAISKLMSTRPRAISLETAVAMLVEAGLPVDEAKAEIDRITERDFEGASELVSAVGDEREAFKYLGLSIPDDFVPSNQPGDEPPGPNPGDAPFRPGDEPVIS